MERNEAIGRLRPLYSATNAENKAALECLIPELKESEDERIRKDIVFLIGHVPTMNEERREKCLAWLEKQKEKKPAEWSEEDEQMRLTCIDIIEHFPIPSGAVVYGPWNDCIDWLKSLRSRPTSSDNWKPSEEQMAALYTAAREAPTIKENGNYLYDLYNDLKKLKV